MKLKITHAFRRPPSDSGWIEVPFISRLVGDAKEEYFYGFETDQPLAREFVETLQQKQEVYQLDYEYQIYGERRLWLSSEGDVFVASANNPLGDPEKVRVQLAGSLYIPRMTWDLAARENALSRSPTVRTIVSKSQLAYEQGDYLNSRRSPGQSYWPFWQEHIRTGIHEELREFVHSISGSPREINLRVVRPEEHQYRNVSRRIRIQRLPLPFEMIFETPERTSQIRVVPLGNVKFFALVWVPDSTVQSELQRGCP
jgi:hypothetical protein